MKYKVVSSLKQDFQSEYIYAYLSDSQILRKQLHMDFYV
jgi:uncharacterized protein (DUF1919 family)